MGSEKIRRINLDLPAGATPISPEEFDDLIPKYITTRDELNAAEFENIGEAQIKYYLAKRKFQFSVSSLYRIHQDMFKNVWRWAGKKRTTNKNIGIDKSQIDAQMKVIIDDLKLWIEQQIDNIEISAQFHHRLVYIHPFNNGNGRWARFIINLFLIEQMNSYLNFPENELLHSTSIRKRYIEALTQADMLDFQLLIVFHRDYLSPFSA
jgi:Fic-DOC domain mobile mystery protein B